MLYLAVPTVPHAHPSQYTFFVAMLYVMVGGLVAALGLCIQVGYSVSTEMD